METTDIKKLREEIDRIDAEMVSLFEKRMEIVNDVCKYKIKNGIATLDKSREESVIEKGISNLKNKEMAPYYIEFQKNVMAVSRKYQNINQGKINVAYSGVKGAFAESAVKHIFPNCSPKSYKGFKSSWDSVVRGECQSCVLPLENSTNGDVGQVLDLMYFSSPLYLKSVIEMPIIHCLLGVKGAALNDIKAVYSHEQALGQCREYLESKGIEGISCENTAVGAMTVAEANDKSFGAVGSVENAELYGLDILDTHINKGEGNTTRFGLFTPVLTSSFSDEKDISSVLMFQVSNTAGALAKAVNIIGLFGYNMKALHSRPCKGWGFSYYFYAELDGNIMSENGIQMQKTLLSCCEGIRVGGVFKTEQYNGYIGEVNI